MVVHYATLKSPIGPSHDSLPERVAAALKDGIRTGQLRPGDRLIEQKLAQDLGVSRNPVREAIRRLASEHLIVITARRGAVIAGLDEREAREVVEVRALLEGYNARLAARRHDKATLKRIEALLKRGEKALADGRTRDLTALNVQFHQETAQAARNEILQDMVQRLRERSAILFSPEEPGQQAALWADHAAILRAILDGDEDQAATLAAGHVLRAGAEATAAEQSEETAPQVRRNSRP